MRTVLIRLLLLPGLLLLAPPASAQVLVASPPPNILLSSTSGELFELMRQEKALPMDDSAALTAQVEARIQPIFDFEQITRLALGRNWRLATPEQQGTLVAEFTTLLMRSFSTAVLNFGSEALEFKQVYYGAGGDTATVRSDRKLSRGQGLIIDFDMKKSGEGWKIVDLKIGGRSLVASYREFFSDVIRDGGIDGLVTTLAAENDRSSSSAETRKGMPIGVLFLYALSQKGFARGG